MRLFDEAIVMFDETLPAKRTKSDLEVLEALAEVRGAFYSSINFMSDQKMHAAHPKVYEAIPVRRRLLEEDDEVFELLGHEQMSSAKLHGATLPSIKNTNNQQGGIPNHQGGRKNGRAGRQRYQHYQSRQGYGGHQGYDGRNTQGQSYEQNDFPAPQQRMDQAHRGNGRGRGAGRGR
jgi:hypothetical protein